MRVDVDPTGHDVAVRGIDHLSAVGRKIVTDLSDLPVADADICLIGVGCRNDRTVPDDEIHTRSPSFIRQLLTTGIRDTTPSPVQVRDLGPDSRTPNTPVCAAPLPGPRCRPYSARPRRTPPGCGCVRPCSARRSSLPALASPSAGCRAPRHWS